MTDIVTNITADDVVQVAVEMLEVSEYLKDQFEPRPANGAASQRLGRINGIVASDTAFGITVSAQTDVEESKQVDIDYELRTMVEASLSKLAEGFRGAYGEQMAVKLAQKLSQAEDRKIVERLSWDINSGSFAGFTVNVAGDAITKADALEARDILLEEAENQVADLMFVMSPSQISDLMTSDHGNFQLNQSAAEEAVGMRTIGTYYGVPTYECAWLDGTRKFPKTWIVDSVSGSVLGDGLTVTLSGAYDGLLADMPFTLAGYANHSIASAKPATSVSEAGGATVLTFTGSAGEFEHSEVTTDGTLTLDAQVGFCINRELCGYFVEFERQAQTYPAQYKAAQVWSLHTKFGFDGFTEASVRILSPRR